MPTRFGCALLARVQGPLLGLLLLLAAAANAWGAEGQAVEPAQRAVVPAASGLGPAKSAPAPSAPTVVSVAPNQLTPGQTYVLALTGANFAPAMQLNFGAGIVLQRVITVTDAGHAQVEVQVAPGTAAGRHLVATSLARVATLTAMPPLKSQGPGYVDVVIADTGGPVALNELLPSQVAQGQQVTLTLRGSGFRPGMALSFGPGITAVGAAQVLSGEQATLAIAVSAQAPALLRHPALLLAGHDVKVSAQATLTVTAPAALTAPARPSSSAVANVPNVPVVLAVAPARLFTGQSYTLSLRGMNFVAQMQVDLGAGIVPKSALRIQSASLATLDVDVQQGAAPGLRWLGLQAPLGLAPLRQDASVLVQRALALTHQGYTPQPGQCTNPKPPVQGTIVLDAPLYSGVTADYGGTFNIPVLNDQTNLTWHEANPGLADRVEVRFYQGSTLVATRALTAAPGYALPHNLVPDAALVAELTSKVQGRATKVVNLQTPPGPLPALHWDLTWQVVGFHTYYDNCVSPSAALGEAGAVLMSKKPLGQGREVEIEHSEVVPVKQPNSGDPLLDLPAAPTGLACNAPQSVSQAPSRRPGSRRTGGGTGKPQHASSDSSLIVQNTTRASQANGATATADYVGDVWQFSGGFDLSDAPWAIESQQSASPTASKKNLVESETLDNVFVDWGDGAVGPLTVQWQGQYCGNNPCFASNTETSSAQSFNLDTATNQGAFAHAYGQAGSFTVRVYMLPASQAQQALPASLGAGSGGLYGRLYSRGGQGAGPGSVASDAYLLACQTLNIQHRTDPVSNGPLQLVDIHITGFPGEQSLGTVRGLIHATTAAPKSPAPVVAKAESARLREGLAPGAGAAQIPEFCSCDVSLVGGASIDYLGQGTVKLTWFQDGNAVGSTEEPIGPSLSRSDAQLAPPKPAPPITSAWPGLQSPALSLAQGQIGKHELLVAAEVVEDANPIRRARTALGDYASHPGAPAPALHGGLSGAPPLGVLGPRGAATAGLPPIQWVNQAPAGAPGIGLHLGTEGRLTAGVAHLAGNPPNEVVSAPAPYQITAADPALPCTFNFPVTGGKFVLGGLQSGGKPTIQQQGGSYSGTGILQTKFADASGTSTQLEQVPIHLQGWTMQPDGVTVANGSFSESPALTPMHVPGLTASLTRIAGTAGHQVTATLSASLANTDIWGANGSKPPAWSGVSATLSPQGDWYAPNLSLPALLVYDSGFSLSAASVTLDLSQADGQGASSQCSGSSGGKAWMGVLLNQASLTAFNFDLPNPPTVSAAAWALDSYGFCGQASFPKGSAAIDQGSVAWDSISANATQGRFTAAYNGLKVHVPWLNTDLTSSQAVTQLTAGQGAGQGGIGLNLRNPSSVTLTEGPVTLAASNLKFASVKGLGWAVTSDTTFGFVSQQGQFASGVVLHGLTYGMNGAATLADGTSARHISLSGQKGNIGGSLVDLKSVDVQLGAPSTSTRLSFAFDSTLNLSKTLPAADVAVSYSITQASAGSYVGAGPVTAPFSLDKPFPDANPTVHLHMMPRYVGGGSGSGGSHSGSGVLFSSSLDMGMFGGPPVSGQFVLGYVGSDDYWLAKAVLDLGPGLSLAPIPLSLFQVGGGMGYNVTLSSFQSSDLTQATPSDDGTLLFDALLLVGSSDHVSVGLSGNFTIKPGGQDPGGRMDYHAWLLDPNWTGQSPFYGHFSYSGGTFDGTLNAQLSLLNDQVALSATNDAIHMHVDSSLWYLHVGTQNNPVQGHVFFASGQAWADIGSDGYQLGVLANLDLNVGDCGGACAYIHDNWLLTASITPSPLAFAANTQYNFSLGACAAGMCLSANESAGVSMSVPPPYLNFSFGLGSCPPGQINVGLQMLPTVNPSIGGNVCL